LISAIDPAALGVKRTGRRQRRVLARSVMTVKYRLAEQVVSRQTNTELRMLFDRRKGVMYELNESASAIVEILEREAVTDEILVASLLTEFDAPAEEVEADVGRTLADFVDAGLVAVE
jgi:PqqD family protein of HPr-rel-A system